MNSRSGIIATAWSFVEKLSTQAISFIIGIFLARLLSPYDYGVVGLTVIFITLSNVFIDAGFANALIQNQQRTEKDLSTAFYFNIIIGIIIYACLWIITPGIALWFNEPLLTSLLRLVGINIILNSLCIVQTAVLTAQLNIRIQTLINLAAQIPAGLVAIFFAFNGFGVYALALQSVLSSLIRTVLLWCFAGWRPRENFCKKSFIKLWNYGSKLLGANLIGTIFNQFYSVAIGKYIGKTELGFYSKAFGLSSNIDGVTSGLVQKVALPVLAMHQQNVAVLTVKFREIMCLLIIFLAPLSAFSCFAANDIITLLWTNKWSSCTPLFQILIMSIMFNPICQMSLSLMQSMGRTDLVLKLEFPKKIIYCIYLAIGFSYNVKGLVMAQLFINMTGAFINIWATHKLLPYSYKKQLIDLFVYVFLAFVIGGCMAIFIQFNNHVLNIVFLFVSIYCIYIAVLIISNDAVFKKYIKKIIL